MTGRDDRNTSRWSGPDHVRQKAGSMGTNPDANAGGSHPRLRTNADANPSVDRDIPVRRPGVDPDVWDETTEGMGAFSDDEARSAGSGDEDGAAISDETS